MWVRVSEFVLLYFVFLRASSPPIPPNRDHYNCHSPDEQTPRKRSITSNKILLHGTRCFRVFNFSESVRARPSVLFYRDTHKHTYSLFICLVYLCLSIVTSEKNGECEWHTILKKTIKTLWTTVPPAPISATCIQIRELTQRQLLQPADIR